MKGFNFMNLYTDGIIWDVDGTLWDITEKASIAWNNVLVQENKRRSEGGETALVIRHPERGGSGDLITPDDLKREFGKPLEDIIDDLIPNIDSSTKESFLDLWCKGEYELLETQTPEPYDGLEDTLRALQDMRIPSFIVSNCETGYIETFMENTHLARYFTDHLCPGDTSQLKAYNIQAIIRKNGLKHAYYIGDIQADCDATREADKALGDSASVGFIWSSYGFGTVKNPDAVLKEVSDLPKIIARI